MLESQGLRLSLVGAVIFAFGLIALIFLPLVVALVALLVGGFGVWGGFIWTLFTYYGPGASAAADNEQRGEAPRP